MAEQTCERLTGWRDALGNEVDTKPCGKPGAHEVTTGCLHEHIRTGFLCERCFRLVRFNPTHCRACFEATGGRLVPSTILEHHPLTEVA